MKPKVISVVNIVGLVLAVISTLFTTFNLIGLIGDKKGPIENDLVKEDLRMQQKNQIDSLTAWVSMYKRKYNELNSKKPNDSNYANQVIILDIDSRLKKLEDALMTTPDKSLSLPLLQKDLQSLRETQTKDYIDLKSSLSATQEQNRWFIGLIFSVITLMITLPSLQHFFSKRKNNADNIPANS